MYVLTAPDTKKKVATALARAMAHARRVSIREHIKADLVFFEDDKDIISC